MEKHHDKKDPIEELHQSHNKLFIAAFKQKPTVVDYLNNFFPKEWVDKMDLDNLTLDTTNYERKSARAFRDISFITIKGKYNVNVSKY